MKSARAAAQSAVTSASLRNQNVFLKAERKGGGEGEGDALQSPLLRDLMKESPNTGVFSVCFEMSPN